MVQRRRLAETIPPVTQAQNRVTPQHAGTGMAHDRFHLVAPVTLITMHRTTGAGRLLRPKPATIQSHGGIIQQSPAFLAGVLRPAGGFFPLSLRASGDRQVVELSWEDGPAALVVLRVAAAGRDTSCFNVPRLCRFLRETGEPWALDLDAVAQKIAQGEFTAWDIDRLPCRDAEVQPGPGTWFIESPFFSTIDAAGGKVVLPQIAWGTHRLFSTAGPSWTLEIGERESVLMPGVAP